MDQMRLNLGPLLYSHTYNHKQNRAYRMKNLLWDDLTFDLLIELFMTLVDHDLYTLFQGHSWQYELDIATGLYAKQSLSTRKKFIRPYSFDKFTSGARDKKQLDSHKTNNK